uniref:Ig-like domain-containing protein n=1 Tax=Pelusios castaneus TaxID=367368 RepID=A0A8C8ST01_9SAUR
MNKEEEMKMKFTGRWSSVPILLLELISFMAGILISQAKTPSYQVNGILGGSVLLSVDPSPGTMVKKIEWSFSAGTAEKIQVAEFNGQKLERPDPSDRFKQRLEIYNTSLSIQALELNDSGSYEARITRLPATQEDWTFFLTVYEPVPEPKIWSVSPSSTSEGCNVTLQCEVSGRENMTVSWRRGNPPQDLSYSERYQLAPDGRTLNLSLQPSPPDSTFTCTASNPVSQRSVSVDLQSVCQIEVDRDRWMWLVCIGLLVIIAACAGTWLWKRKRKRPIGRGRTLLSYRNTHGPSNWQI